MNAVAVGVAQYLACIVDNIAMLLSISYILDIPCFDRTCRRSSKKADPGDCKNYKPTCPLNAAYNCFAMILSDG